MRGSREVIRRRRRWPVWVAAAGTAALAASAAAVGPGVAYAGTDPLVVLDQSVWTDTAGQVHLIGDIKNNGAPVESVHATLDLLNASGATIATVTAYTLSETLNTGADRPFEVAMAPPAGFAGKFVVEAPTGVAATQPEPDVLSVTVTAVDPTHQTADELEGTVTNTGDQDLVGAEIGSEFFDSSGHLVLVSYAPAQNSTNGDAVPAHTTSNWSLPWIDGSPTWSTYRVSAETELSQKTPGVAPGAGAAAVSSYPVAPGAAKGAAGGYASAPLAPAVGGLPRTLKATTQPPPVAPASAVSTTVLAAPAAASTTPAGNFTHDALFTAAGIAAAVAVLALMRRVAGPVFRRRT